MFWEVYISVYMPALALAVWKQANAYGWFKVYIEKHFINKVYTFRHQKTQLMHVSGLFISGAL